MVGWHHQLNAHEFEQTPGDGGGHHMPEEPGELQSMGLKRVRHDLATEQQQLQQRLRGCFHRIARDG